MLLRAFTVHRVQVVARRHAESEMKQHAGFWFRPATFQNLIEEEAPARIGPHLGRYQARVVLRSTKIRPFASEGIPAFGALLAAL